MLQTFDILNFAAFKTEHKGTQNKIIHKVSSRILMIQAIFWVLLSTKAK